MKDFLKRWREASLLDKIGFVAFSPIVLGLVIMLSPIILFVWAGSSFSAIANGENDYDY